MFIEYDRALISIGSIEAIRRSSSGIIRKSGDPEIYDVHIYLLSGNVFKMHLTQEQYEELVSEVRERRANGQD